MYCKGLHRGGLQPGKSMQVVQEPLPTNETSYFFALTEELHIALQRVGDQTQVNLSLLKSIQRNVAKPYCAILEGRFQQNQDLQQLLTTVAGEGLITTGTTQLDSTQPFFASNYDVHLCRARTIGIQHWGAEVVLFYSWHTQSKNSTDRLRTLAKKCTWTEATKRIDLAISESCRTGGSQRDLTAQHRRIVDSEIRTALSLDTLLLTGLAQYDVDQYGILYKWHSWRATESRRSQYGCADDEARAKAAAEVTWERAGEEAGEAKQRGAEEPTTCGSQDRRANGGSEEPKGSPDEEEDRSDAEAQWDEEEAGAEEEEFDEETAQRGGADGVEEGLEAESQVDGEEIDTEKEADDEEGAAEADADNTQSPTSSNPGGDVSESDRAYQTRTTPEDYTQDKTLRDQLRSIASARECSNTAGHKRRR
ncbi:hypothetical protein LTR56_023567 [Elasticomyces elasticus]|nr:hypothetical protein LTR56_023567 [Elasticomyces elasticus]KAK3624235.1 hypothetical protein LTR22_024063 [Elasticomyces elasticus]KAK4906083.1 hypothetical protein LTR49_024711 [Elasticomyces elasticus]KAK5744113.1 hypothetical protein LTS12_023589 [Elasticomyces elasticus]